MGRGYSKKRSSSRPVEKTKRDRSLSLGRLKAKMEIKPMEDVDESEYELSEDEEELITVPDVFNKYKRAGKITEEALAAVCAACVEGANTRDLCKLGDDLINEKCAPLFSRVRDPTDNNRPMKKGICYPTNVSVNGVACNHCPIYINTEHVQEQKSGKKPHKLPQGMGTAVSGDPSITLKRGDVVKVHLGTHINGFPTMACRTIFVGDQEGINELPAVAAAANALRGMIRMMRPGTVNSDITDFIHHMCHHFDVNPIEGTLSNRAKRWILDGNKAIIARRVVREDPQQDVMECTIDENTVWILDVAVTNSNNYKLVTTEEPNHIVRRNDMNVSVRHPASVDLVNECREKFACFPFSPSHTTNPLRSKLGMAELRRAGMLDEMPVLACRQRAGEGAGKKAPCVVARFSCTVAITEKKIHVLCGDPVLQAAVEQYPATLKPFGDDVKALLKSDLSLKSAATDKSGAVAVASTTETMNPDVDGAAANMAMKRRRK